MNEKSPQQESGKITSEDVIGFYTALDDLGIKIWVDGGWGVDALLEKQTRVHGDLDIAVQQKDASMLRELLESRGYKDIRTESARPHNFVLGDDRGREIDVHVIVFDAKGNGIFGPAENGEMYPAAALTGNGTINGKTVRCISPEWMVKFHSGYELKEKDFADVSALCGKFGIELPIEYIGFKESKI